jgi:osmotically-inducible protein OsmY
MKKALASLVLSAALVAGVGCSNWSRNTPGPLDNTTMETEIRRNLAEDHITGLQIEVHDGMVTLNGHGSRADRQKAYDDAAKVKGVKSVTNNITAD